MPLTRLTLCLFFLVASCQQNPRARAALGRCDKGGSEMEMAGFQHLELMSSVPFLGEGVIEVATEGGEGVESKDKRSGRRGQNSRMSLSLGFCRGQWKRSLLLFQPAPAIMEKAFLGGWSVSGVPASPRQYVSFSMDLDTGGSTGHGFAP